MCDCNKSQVLGLVGENKRVLTLDTTMAASAVTMAVDVPLSVAVYEFKCAFHTFGGLTDFLELRLLETVADSADVKRPKARALFFHTSPATPVASTPYNADMTKFLFEVLIMNGQAVHTTPNQGYRRINPTNNQAHVPVNSSYNGATDSTSVFMVLLADEVVTPVTGTTYSAELVVKHNW